MKMHLKKLFLAVTCLLTGIAVNSQDRNNLIKPGTIWPDTEGKHINAHGGGILIL